MPDTDERYGLYAFANGELTCIATAPDAEGIGAAIVANDEDEREAHGLGAALGDRGRIGIRDRLMRRWIVSPFPTSPTV